MESNGSLPLLKGSKWPLVEISKNERQQVLVDALTFGNHKGALQKPVILKKLIAKDLKYRCSLHVPLSSVQSILGLMMAPMNIMEQNTIDKFGQIIPKDRLTDDQSWKWSSGTSVNSRCRAHGNNLYGQRRKYIRIRCIHRTDEFIYMNSYM
jgi:hypothetical protein